jgi:hypothetical protein
MRNNLVPRRRIQVRYVTVTQMRGHSCTVEVPVVSVSAVVDDYPHGSICHTATTRRNRARARLESEPHDLDELPLSRLRGISPGSDKLSCFPGLLSTFRGSDTAGRTVEHGHIGTHWATTNFADNSDYVKWERNSPVLQRISCTDNQKASSTGFESHWPR